MIVLTKNYTLAEAVELTGIDAETITKRITSTGGLYSGYDVHRCGLLIAIERFNQKFGGKLDEI